MIPLTQLSQLSRPARVAVRLLWVAGIGGLAVFTAAAGFGLGDPRSRGFEALYVCLHLSPAGLCILRALVIQRERLVWGLLGVGMLVWGAGYAYYFAALAHLDPQPYPSFADALWIAYLASAFVAILLLMRERLTDFRRSLWADAAVGALALAAVGAAFLEGPILASTGGSVLTVAAGLAYPLADLLVIGMVLGVFALSGWTSNRTWILIGAGFAIQTVADASYLYEAASGNYQTGTLIEAMWPAAMLIVALAGWQKPERLQGGQFQGVPAIVVTSTFAAVGLVVMTVDHWTWVNDVALVLATLTILGAFIRTALTFSDMRTLAIGRQLMQEQHEHLELAVVEARERASCDPLTGLLNHREFQEGVQREADRALRDGPNFSVVLFDVDGFKRVNDDYGHAEGDRLLRTLAATLTQSGRAGDLVCRVGGDEFAIVLPGSDATAAGVVGRRVQHDTEALQAGVGISFGISDWATDGPVTETMLLRADVALYAAKPTHGGAPGRSRSRSAIDGPREAGDVVSHILAAAREQLDVDVVMLSEFADGQQVFRALEGDTASFGLEKDASVALEHTYCQRMVAGRLPNLIVDAKADRRVNQLAATQAADLGAYLGVPVELSDGSLYGTLCCVSHAAEPSLGERDVAYMRLLARLIANQLENHARGTEIQRQQKGEAAIGALLSALAARDSYTGSHSLDVVELARKVCHQLRLADEQVADAEQVALLHDLGKIGIPDAILQKAGKLDPHEWQVMRQHPVIGAQIIASVSSLNHLAPAVRAEHERFDGHGYPDGLAAGKIPLGSRIVFACDAYHAMISDRPYRRAMHENDAKVELQANAGTQFDPEVVAALLRVLERLNPAQEPQISLAGDQAGAPPAANGL